MAACGIDIRREVTPLECRNAFGAGTRVGFGNARDSGARILAEVSGYGMGADFRDLDQDGRPDVFLTALSGEPFPLYLNTADARIIALNMAPINHPHRLLFWDLAAPETFHAPRPERYPA